MLKWIDDHPPIWLYQSFDTEHAEQSRTGGGSTDPSHGESQWQMGLSEHVGYIPKEIAIQ